MNLLKLPRDIKQAHLQEAFRTGYRLRSMGRMERFKLNPQWEAWFADWFKTTFQTQNLESEPDFGFMVTPAGLNGEAHIDIHKGDFRDGRGRRTHVRLSAINQVVDWPQGCGRFEYLDQQGSPLEGSDYKGLAAYKTDVWHRAYNADGAHARVVLSIGLYRDSFDKLVILDRTGRLLRG